MNTLSQNSEPALGSYLSPDLANSKFTVFNCLYTMNRKFKRYPPEKDPNADVPKSNEQRENTSELLTLICQVKDARVVLYTIDEVVYFEVGRPIPDRL